MNLTSKELKRFWGKVVKDCWLYPQCWIWIGDLGPRDYGRFRLSKKAVGVKPRRFFAHRLSWELFHDRKIPEGMQIDHLCREHKCINPAHLEAVTPRENTLRGEGPSAKNAKKTHCPVGHSLAGENLYINNGKRSCLICKNLHTAICNAKRSETKNWGNR